jgi:nitric oxide reductase subunit C
MYSVHRIITVPFVSLLLFAAGCVRMPIPTSVAPGSSSSPSTTTTAQPAPSLTAAPSPSATTSSSSTAASTPPANGAGDPANGAKLFAQLPCNSCHDVTKPFPGGVICPNLGNIATEAARIVQSPDYHGKATDAAGYIRESILDPNVYIVPGDVYHSADGQSVMPKDFGKTLTASQIDDLVAYLLTLK